MSESAIGGWRKLYWRVEDQRKGDQMLGREEQRRIAVIGTAFHESRTSILRAKIGIPCSALQSYNPNAENAETV